MGIEECFLHRTQFSPLLGDRAEKNMKARKELSSVYFLEEKRLDLLYAGLIPGVETDERKKSFLGNYGN